MSQLWVPTEVSTEDLVTRVQQQVREFAQREGCAHVLVEVQLREGGTLKLDTLSAEPGHGFLTLRPHADGEDEREELIVPLGSISQIRIAAAEAEPRFGFGLPDAPA